MFVFLFPAFWYIIFFANISVHLLHIWCPTSILHFCVCLHKVKIPLNLVKYNLACGQISNSFVKDFTDSYPDSKGTSTRYARNFAASITTNTGIFRVNRRNSSVLMSSFAASIKTNAENCPVWISLYILQMARFVIIASLAAHTIREVNVIVFLLIL